MSRHSALILFVTLLWFSQAEALEVTVSWSPPKLYTYPPPVDLTLEGCVYASFQGDEPMTPLDAPWLFRLSDYTWRGTWLWDDKAPREVTFVPDGGGDPVELIAVRQPARPLDLSAHDGMVITVDTAVGNIWSPETGLYVWGLHENCLQSGIEWERPADITAYAPEGSLQWQEPVGLRINGQSTRKQLRKGLRSYFDDYGSEDWLEADIFGGGSGRFARLVYKSTYHPTHVLSSSLFEPLHRDLGHLGSRHRLAGLYLVGEYWGAYSLRERLDDCFIELTHELAEDGEYTLIKDDEAAEGDVQEWYEFLADYAEPPQDYGANDWYVAMERQLDLEAYMDWMFLNIFGASADNGWVNNIALLRLDGGCWQYIMWDEEGLMAAANLESNHFRFYASADAVEFEQFRPPAWSMGDWWPPHQPWRDLFRGLMQNSRFKARFSARIDELMAGPVSVSSLNARLDSLETIHSQELARHLQRWAQPTNSYTDEVQRARVWLGTRAPIVAAQKLEFFEYFAVPVELSEFAATPVQDGAQVAWRTERERDNRGFQIWRSIDGPDDMQLLADWRDHHELVGAPDSDLPCDYLFVDTTFPPNQTAWYQLRHEAVDGSITVHDWIEMAGSIPLPKLRLNELMADNESVIADEAGEFDDWIEICNTGSLPLSLEGLALSDEIDDPSPWPLPALVLDPGAFLLVWCDDDTHQGPLHADFKLSADGEVAALFLLAHGYQSLIDSVAFGPQIPNFSFGRLPDGDGIWQILPSPTPGSSNQAATGVISAHRRELILHGVWPNPAGGFAKLQFTLGVGRAGPVRVDIYDLQGRRVRSLARCDLSAGDHEMVWDLRDRRGYRVPAGIYLLRVSAGGASKTVKLTYAK